MFMNHYEKKISRSVRETKSLGTSFEVKKLAEDGQFAGYASVFDVVDSQSDVVMSGAFIESISSRRSDIKLLWQHHPDEPIGEITNVFEDPQGLYVEGRLALDVPRGQEAYSMLRKGVVKGMSIGYSPVRYSYDPDSGVRRLHKVDLWEVSLVTFPANEQAQISVFKSSPPPNRAAHCLRSSTPPQGRSVKQDSMFNWNQAAENGQLLKFQSALDRAIYATKF